MDDIKKLDGLDNKGVSLVVTAIPNSGEMQAVNEYIDGTFPKLLAAGGKIKKRVMVHNVIHGKTSGMVIIMDFDDENAIKRVFGSKEYEAFIPVRNRAFHEINIQIAENF